MKLIKISAFVLCFALVWTFIFGCGSQEEETKIIDTTKTQTTISSLAETTETSLMLADQYDPNESFQSFDPFGGGGGTFFGKVSVFDLALSSDPILLRFLVIGVLQDAEGWAKYQVKVTALYGTSMEFDKEKIYTMNFRGSSDTPRYGRPLLEIGQEYVRFSAEIFESNPLMQASLIFKVVDDEQGTYIYGYGVDLSSAECAIPITDEKENAIYEEGKHDKILAYLKSIGQEIPVFEYKCEVNALLKEIREH